MTNHNYGVIMAGGIGSRFWPMSTSDYPKQFHDILGTGKTFLQQTFDRLNQFISEDQIFIVTTEKYASLTLSQIPQISENQIISEPTGRNTAACNLYTALKIHKLDPNATLLVAPSDHFIIDETRFKEIATMALQKAQEKDVLITMGIEPTRPDTGYGYIQYKTENETSDFKEVKTFTEKPNQEIAEKFIESGDFLWNSGIFIWSAKSIIRGFEAFLPEMHQSMITIEKDLHTDAEPTSIQRVYPTLQNISIDNGIMEKAKNVFVIPSSLGWSDLGTWGSLYENLEKNEDGNILHGKHSFTYNTKNSIIKTNQDKVIVIDGLEDYIIVDTEKSLLICPRNKDQEVKRYVNDLKLKKKDNFV